MSQNSSHVSSKYVLNLLNHGIVLLFSSKLFIFICENDTSQVPTFKSNTNLKRNLPRIISKSECESLLDIYLPSLAIYETMEVCQDRKIFPSQWHVVVAAQHMYTLTCGPSCTFPFTSTFPRLSSTLVSYIPIHPHSTTPLPTPTYCVTSVLHTEKFVYDTQIVCALKNLQHDCGAQHATAHKVCVPDSLYFLAPYFPW